ncbi:MAG: leucine-rich repeat domain-containing protein [Cyanobacteria bacterium P01_G01_bin.54]
MMLKSWQSSVVMISIFLAGCRGVPAIAQVETREFIEELSSLGTLTNLQQLVLYGNEIQDIPPLRTLNHLRQLWLEDNQIQDISSLSALVNLEWLAISHNQIQDIRPLSPLTNLQTLGLIDNLSLRWSISTIFL